MSCNTDYLKGTGSLLLTQLSSDGEIKSSVSGVTFNTTSIYKQPFSDESINPSANSFDSAAIVGGRTVLDTDTSLSTISGSTTIELNALNMGYLLFAALGGISSYTATIQIFVPSINTIPFYNVWVYHGGASGYIQKYSCMAVNSLSVSLDGGSVVSASIDWMGLSNGSSAAGSISATPVHDHVYFSTDIYTDNSSLEVTHGIASDTVSHDEAVEVLANLSFTINNNLDSSAISLNGNVLAIEEGMAEYSGSVTFSVPDISYIIGVYEGGWDASTTAYPTVDVNTGDAYVITTGGTISGTVYVAGDWIIYNGATWDKIAAGTAESLAATLLVADVGDSYLEGGLKTISFELVNTDSDEYDTYNKVVLNNIKITSISHDISGQGLLQFSVDFKCINKATSIDSTIASFSMYTTTIKNALKDIQEVGVIA